jgi:hypothetical protein
MCGGAKPPEPQAPPAPVPQRDEAIEARQNTQQQARRAAASGFQSTLLTNPNQQGAVATTPVLGG